MAKNSSSRRRSLLGSKQIAQFEELAMNQKGLFAHICRAMGHRFDVSSTQQIKERCEVVAGKQITRLRLPVKILNLCAAAAPLIGLMGTIYGMIIVFEAVAGSQGAAKAAALAAGIRVKLFCTLFALCIAIPSLFLYFIYNHALSVIINNCEVLTDQFLQQVSLLKGDGRAASAPGVAVPSVPHVPTTHAPTASAGVMSIPATAGFAALAAKE